MRFRTLSPICVSQNVVGEKHAQYVAPEQEQFSQLLVQNLLRKQQAHQRQLTVPFRVLSKPEQKLIHVRGTKIRCYLFNFELTAPTDLLEMGYFSGFGEKNSMGFGMVRLINT